MPCPSSSSSPLRPPPQGSTCSVSPARTQSKIPPAHRTQTTLYPDATPSPHPNSPHAPEWRAAHLLAILALANISRQQTDAPPLSDAFHNPYRAATPRWHTSPQTPQPPSRLVPAAPPPSLHKLQHKPKPPAHACASSHLSSTPAT